MISSGTWSWFGYFLGVIILTACGTPLKPVDSHQDKVAPKRPVRLEYAVSLDPYLDDKGSLVLPGQKLERWTGRTFVGSSSYDLVPID